MFGWIQKQLLALVVGFAVRQFVKWTTGFDWSKFEADVKERIPSVIPGTWFDGIATDFVLNLVSLIKSVATEQLITKVATLAAAGKFEEAFSAIKDAVIGQYYPQEEVASLSEEKKDELVIQAAVKHVDTAQA